jgi:hypothetical protein
VAQYGAYTYESTQSRALNSIRADSYNKDMAKNLIELNNNSEYMAQYLRKLQQGVDQANQNVIEQITSFVNDIIVLLGGGNAQGFDFGDLKYVFGAIGSLFGFTNPDGSIKLPPNLFESAWHFVSTYIIPVAGFGDAINALIDSAIGTIVDWTGGIPIIGETVQQLAVWLLDGRDNLDNLFTALGGALGDAAGAITAFLTKVYDQWIQPIVDFINTAIGNPLGQAFESIVGAVSRIFNLASGADAKATQALGSARPLWETIDGNGEVSTPLATADATMAVTSTASRGAFIRCVGGTTKTTISCIAYKTGTVSTCFFDIYRLEPNGSATWLYTTVDQQANLSTTATVLFVEMPTDSGIAVDVATNYLTICRITGSGSVVLQGRTFPTTTSSTRPLYPGILRDPTGSVSPSTITSGTLDTLYVVNTPYIQLGSLSDILPQSFFVDFTTVSNLLWVSSKVTTLGIPFNIQHLTADNGVLKVINAGSVDVSGWAAIMYRYGTATQNCRVGVKLAEPVKTYKTYAMMFGRLDFSNYLSIGFSSTGCGIYRANNSTALYTFDTVTTNSYGTFSTGDWIYLEYDDVEEKFYVYKNPDWASPTNRNSITAGGHVIFSILKSNSGFTGLNMTPSFRSGGVLMTKDISGYDNRSTFIDDYICEDWVNPAA